MSYGVLRLLPWQVDRLTLGQWLDLLHSRTWVMQERERHRRMADPDAEVSPETRGELLGRIQRVYGGE